MIAQMLGNQVIGRILARQICTAIFLRLLRYREVFRFAILSAELLADLRDGAQRGFQGGRSGGERKGVIAQFSSRSGVGFQVVHKQAFLCLEAIPVQKQLEDAVIRLCLQVRNETS